MPKTQEEGKMRNKGRLEKKEDIKEGETMDYKLTAFFQLAIKF